MTASHYGILTSYDHNVQSWKNYKSRITQWFIANNITSTSDAQGVKRRAILLSALAEGTFQLASDLALPKDVQDVPYEDIIKLLDDHFTPKRLGFGERSTFYNATQNPDESFSQWAARLRGLTAYCNFSNVEEALRDKFVMGLLPGREREKLFAQDLTDLTLAKAVKLAEAIRCARTTASTSTSTSRTPALCVGNEEQLFKINNNAANAGQVMKKCLVCGRFNHPSSKCRFANYTCKKCNKKGHLQKMCGKVNFVSIESVDENGDDGEIFNIQSKYGEPMVESVKVSGIPLNFEIDSGSAVSVIADNIYNTYFKNTPLLRTGKKLCTYVGNQMNCAGYIRVPVTYLGQTYNLNIYVICGGGPPLLGRDFISSFKLSFAQCNFLNCSEKIMRSLQSLYPEVFSNELGTFKKCKIKLQLKPGSQPIFFKARPVAFALKDKIDTELDRLTELGILKPVEHSDYASPIVPVLKRNGAIRICADYSVSINKQLIIEQYPLPSIQELFTKLYGGQQFSKIDLSMAYNQFVLDDDSQHITCINTHRGLYKYTRMVFGMSSAPSIFQRAMDCLLSGMEGVLCLLDDILITGVDYKQHVERLQAVFCRLRDAGLVVQKDKCEFFKEQINYLGYTIDKAGLKKSEEKVKAMLQAPVPNNVMKLQSFLGLVNYYRNFIPNASSILSPLYDLLKKGVKWTWSQIHDNSFNTIKKYLASEQVLAHFNPKNNVILTVDASPNGLGAILSQLDTNGVERPISFASRTLNSAEKKYSQIQKEATAIIFGVRRFHQYLYGRSEPFILRTDHKPLISIFGPYKGIPEVSANRLQRYALFLSGYNYRIEYVSSNNNCADFLSRASLPNAETGGGALSVSRKTDDCNLSVGTFARLSDPASYIHFVLDGSFPITRNDLRIATDSDETLAQVKNYVMQGWPKKISETNLRSYYLCRTQLAYEDGCLMRGHKIVLPEKLRSKILSELHKSHLGIVKTKAEARSRFWFPGIDASIEGMIGSCLICTQLRSSPPQAPMSPWKYPPQPFYRIHLDFLGPLHGSMYLVIVDAYTKWVEVFNTPATSNAVVEKLYEYVSRFGLPHTIVTDNATTFTSDSFKTFCTQNGVIHLTSPAYHPASNGQAESYVKIVKKGIKSCILSCENVTESKLKLFQYLYDYRNSIHSTTLISPAQLVYGRTLRSRLDLLNKPPISSTNLNATVQNKQCSQIKHHGGKNKKTFKIDEQVLFKMFLNNTKYIWRRGTIIQHIGKVMYLVKDILSKKNVKKHKNQLMCYRGIRSNNQDNWDCDIELPDIMSTDVSPSDVSHAAGVESEPDQMVAASNQDGGEGDPSGSPSHDASAVGGSLGSAVVERGNPSSRLLLRSLPKLDYRSFF
ncbi:hypothetical protein O3G_MSEX014427 [Manduca sexta]|uniref:RNA-directed DNA polymerase n=1 Tax=Manduca sexta TaxID=7130 RepID=A0A921ZW08_MANSE|nr:hypothetical protein O3G_MSEX014427 [Manduca sexta]